MWGGGGEREREKGEVPELFPFKVVLFSEFSKKIDRENCTECVSIYS